MKNSNFWLFLITLYYRLHLLDILYQLWFNSLFLFVRIVFSVFSMLKFLHFHNLSLRDFFYYYYYFANKYINIYVIDFLDSCRASTLLAELDDDEDLPEPDEEDDENEDDNQEDQEYEEVMVKCSYLPYLC